MKLLLAPAFAATLLAGCISYPVDEGWFFRPRDIGEKATTPADMKIIGEENLRAPGKFSEDFGCIFPDFAARIPARVAHGFVELGELRIATTRVTGANAVATEPLIVACMGQTGDRINSGLNYTAKLLPWARSCWSTIPAMATARASRALRHFTSSRTSSRRTSTGRPAVAR